MHYMWTDYVKLEFSLDKHNPVIALSDAWLAKHIIESTDWHT